MIFWLRLLCEQHAILLREQHAILLCEQHAILLCEQHAILLREQLAINKHFLMYLLNAAIFCQLRASHVVSFSLCQQHFAVFKLSVFKSDVASSIRAAGRLHMTRFQEAGNSKSAKSIPSQQQRNTQLSLQHPNDFVKNELYTTSSGYLKSVS